LKWIRLIIVTLVFMVGLVIYQSFTYADEVESVSTYKSWTITFNTPISPDYVNSDSIYIVNESTGKRVTSVKLRLSEDQKVVNIQPTVPYDPQTTFTVHIEKPIVSTKGMPMMNTDQKEFKTKAKPKYSEQAMEYFQEIAFGSEWGQSDFPIRKWNTDPRIKVFGNPSEKDMGALKDTINDINTLQDHIELRLVDKNPNIKIYFVPLEDFDQYVDNPKEGNWGLFYYWWESGSYVVDEAEILISTDKPSQKARQHLVREELTQTLGLPRDSYSYPKSMFFQDYTTVTEFTALDKQLIQMLYEDQIQAGMTPKEAIEVFHNLIP